MKRNETAARGVILALFALTVWMLFLVFKPFLSAIAWALFLTSAFYPLHRRILGWTRRREWLSAAISALLVSALIIGPAAWLIGSLVSSVSEYVTSVAGASGAETPDGPEDSGPAADEAPAGAPADAASILEPGAATQPGPVTQPGAAMEPGGGAAVERVFPFLHQVETFLGRFIDTSRFDLEASAMTAVKKLGSALAGQATPLAQNVFSTLGQLLVMIAVMVFLFHDGPKYLASVRRMLPLPEPDRDAVLQNMHDVAGAVFYGVMLTAAIQGTLGGIGWAMVGLPSAITFGIAMFFCALLPGGTVVVWGPGALYLFSQGHTFKAIVLVVWGALVVSTIDNVIKPIFIGGRTKLNMLLVFFGIVGGMAAFGFTGLFLGPMVITLFLSLLDLLRRDWFPEEAGPPTSSSTRS